MASISQLQKALDNNLIDTSTLNKEQLTALDKGFKTGTLKGYPNVNALREEQGATAETLAREKEQQLRPFEAATGLKRLDFEVAGDVFGSLAPYIMDRNKIVQAYTSSGGRATYALERVGQSAKTIQGLTANVVGATPMGKRIKWLGRTTAVLGRIWRGIQASLGQAVYGTPALGKIPGMAKAAPQAMRRPHQLASQLLQTELKSQMLGSFGAAGGSITYGVAEALTDLGGATHEDLARVSDNQIDKLPPLERETVHAMQAMSNAFLFNAGAFALMPLLGAMVSGMRGVLGLKGEAAEALAKDAYKYGYDTNISAVMDANRGAFAGFMKGYSRSVGVFPLIASKRLAHRNAQMVQFYNNYLQNIDAAVPMSHAQLLALGSLGQFRKNFKETFDVVATKYEQVLDATKHHGLEGLRIVPSEHVGAYVDRVLRDLEMQYPEMFRSITQRIGANTPINEFDDPMVQFIQTLKSLADQGGNMTVQEFIGLQKMLSNVIPSSKIQDPRGYIMPLREAMEKDWHSIVPEGQALETLLKSKTFKEAFDAQVAQGGKEAGDAYVARITKGLSEVSQAQKDANAFFHNTMLTYSSPVAQTIKKADPNIFTNLGLVGITSRATIMPDEMWDKAIRSVFRSKSAMGIEEMKKLIGYGKNKTGTNMFDRFRELYIYDAFKSSFDILPARLTEKGLYSVLNEAMEAGVVNKRWIDQLNDSFVLESGLKGIRPDELLQSGIGDVPWKALKAEPGKVGEFQVERFAKNLGLTGNETEIAAAKSKLIQMYGGGQKGKDALHHLETMINIMRAEKGVDISDPSVFLQRKITLGAAGGFGRLPGTLARAATVGVGTQSPFLTLGLVWLGRHIGGYLGDPRALKKTYDLFTEMERINMKVGGDRKVIKGFAKMLWDPTHEQGKHFRRGFAQWFNMINEEDKDVPRVHPNNIDFEEITNYLNSTPDKVPAPKWDKNALIPSVKSRSYGAEKELAKYSTAALAAGDNFLIGIRNGIQKDMEAMEADYSILTGAAPPPQQTAGQQVTGPDPMGGSYANIPQTGGNRGQQYQSLWPQDNLGQGIANKNA